MPLPKGLLDKAFTKIAIITLVFVIITTLVFIFFIIPHIHDALIDEKRQSLYEISNFITTTFYELDAEEQHGTLAEGQAQKFAIHMINSFRYGQNKDDYFWINNINNGNFLVHPFEYLHDENIENLVDVQGYRFGKDMLDIARSGGDELIIYQWPSKNDPSIHVTKMSHVTKFEPWGWMIGTGIYIDDVENEVNAIVYKIIVAFMCILILMIILLIFIIRVGSKIEHQKNITQLEFMSLIQHLPIGVFRVELQKNTINTQPLIWNKALTNLFELPRKEYPGKKGVFVKDFFKHKQDMNIMVQKALNNGQLIGEEYEMCTYKDNILWIKIYGQLVKKDNKIYLDASMENITKKHEVTALLEKSYNELRKVDRMKNEIISITSHELRTPLTIIKGFASLLSQESVGKCNESQKKYLSKIITNTDALLEMITNMLDLERLETGKMQFKIEETNLNKLLIDVHDYFQIHSTLEKKLLTLELPDSNIIIDTDPEQLKRIFVNLIENAIKFTKSERGEIKIFTKKINSAKIEVHIKDNGIGIADTDLADVFEKFKQVDGHIKRVYSGSGLGLSIVKKLITGLNGTVNVQSDLHKGSDFYITLPLKNNF